MQGYSQNAAFQVRVFTFFLFLYFYFPCPRRVQASFDTGAAGKLPCPCPCFLEFNQVLDVELFIFMVLNCDTWVSDAEW